MLSEFSRGNRISLGTYDLEEIAMIANDLFLGRSELIDETVELADDAARDTLWARTEPRHSHKYATESLKSLRTRQASAANKRGPYVSSCQQSGSSFGLSNLTDPCNPLLERMRRQYLLNRARIRDVR